MPASSVSFIAISFSSVIKYQLDSHSILRKGKVAALLFISFLSFSATSHAQLEGRNWYFGENAGLDFSTSPPSALTNGALRSHEGCATISDRRGNILFYTNGVTVYNKDHQIMDNGASLGGNVSAAQSSLIIPFVGDTNLFYLFTIDNEGGPGGLQYNTIDIAANGGLGAVVNRHIQLKSRTCEMMTVVPHGNQEDFWLVSHDFNSPQFTVYLITRSGIRANQVISTVGPSLGSNKRAAVGQVKISPDFKTLAATFPFTNECQIYNFDNLTGVISDPINVTPTSIKEPYGIEFSPNNELLYISFAGGVAQFDISSRNEPTIQSSGTTLITGTALATLQLGIDRRIYFAPTQKSIVQFIKFPDRQGLACQFDAAGVSLNGRICNLGLPNIPPFLLSPNPGANYRACVGESVSLILADTSGIDSIQWFIPASLPATDTTLFFQSDPIVSFSFPGSYRYRCIYFSNGVPSQFKGIITIDAYPVFSLGPDREICGSEPVWLAMPQDNSLKYLWSTDSTKATTIIDKSGTYWATAFRNGCTHTDTITVTFYPTNKLEFDPITFCQGQSYTYTLPTSDSATYVWADSFAEPTRTFTDSGLYLVQSISNYPCYSWIDTIHVSIIPPHPYPSELQFTPTFQCITNSMTLQASDLPGALISWDGGPFTSSTSHQLSLSNSRVVPIAIAYPCDTFQFSYLIPARDSLCSCPYFIASAFHPTSSIEGNKRFAVNLACTPSEFQLHIYNRWGQHVFCTTNPFEAWDGTTSSGSSCPEGVYLYQTQFLKPDGIWARESGTVHLIR